MPPPAGCDAHVTAPPATALAVAHLPAVPSTTDQAAARRAASSSCWQATAAHIVMLQHTVQSPQVAVGRKRRPAVGDPAVLVIENAVGCAEKVGAEVVECGCIIELPELKGREKLGKYELFVLAEKEGL